MGSWFEALRKTRRKLGQSLTRLWRPAQLDETSIEEIEETLLGADVSIRLVQELLEALRNGAPHERLRGLLLEQLGPSEPFVWGQHPRPECLLIVGVNGSGKTTTCAKLAHQAQRAGQRPLLAAADTFRAAGSHQLNVWGEQLGLPVVGGKQGADAAAVVFDAFDAAQARQAGLLIVDTAGRMHTRKPLMEELRKVQRALARKRAGAPDEVWIVLDASNGQNALIQARTFHEAVPLTGVVIAKLDGSARAGFLFSIRQELGVPIRFAGLGEGPDDLAPFNPQAFVDALLVEDQPSMRSSPAV